MANTYTWNVGQCDRTLSDGMIITLHYTVSAVTEDGVYSAGAYGSVGLEAAEADSMIAYDKVSKEQAVVWAKSAIGDDSKIAEIYRVLDNELLEKRTPTIGVGTPWSD